MGTMLAAVLHDFNDLVLEEVQCPEPTGNGEVVVRIKACGICATDYKAIKGIRRNVEFPFIPGHEPSGIVAEVGPGVEYFRVGDEVIVMPSGYCGYCKHCREGNIHYCENGYSTGGDGASHSWPGAFAQYMKTTERSLFHKPAGLSFDCAAISEPLSGAWKGTIQYSQMQVGDDVIVIGVGGIGLLCMMVARVAGAARLIAIDPSPYARKQALELGASHVIDPVHEDVKRRVYEIIPEGPDLIIEAAGPIEAVRMAVG
jgi:L-iditol 2-dehydrogenase